MASWAITKNFGQTPQDSVKPVNPVPAKMVEHCRTFLVHDGCAAPEQWLPLRSV